MYRFRFGISCLREEARASQAFKSGGILVSTRAAGMN